MKVNGLRPASFAVGETGGILAPGAASVRPLCIQWNHLPWRVVSSTIKERGSAALHRCSAARPERRMRREHGTYRDKIVE